MTFTVDLVSAIKDENPEQFKTRVMRAEMQGLGYVEATEEMCRYFNPNGMGASPFFNYSKVRVYKEGTKEAQDMKESMQLHQRLHHDDAFFEGRT